MSVPMTLRKPFPVVGLLIGALVFLVRMVRRSQRDAAAPVLDAAQREKAKSLLQDTEPRS